jgi:hypothetical protein
LPALLQKSAAMDAQNLQYNIIPFGWPDEEVTFYFNRDAHPNHYRLHQRLFPNELERVFPGVEGSGVEFAATSFDRPMEGFVPLDIDLQYDNTELAKLYFQYKVLTYFQGLGNLVTGRGFTKGVQVWAPAFKYHTAEFLTFECFTLRVFGRWCRFGVQGGWLRPQNLPVSVLYPEMIARMVVHFPGRLPEGGKRGCGFCEIPSNV